ncbi:MAG: MFS transporter [Oscillospiraceae bacterium]|nr:MFS transporter [Oscillospiraceae bacterium]
MDEKKKLTIWTKGFTCAFLANCCLCFSQHIVNTLISTYAVYLGAGAVLMGTITGMYYGIAFAVRPFSGPIITSMDKKNIMLFTYALGVITNIAYVLSGNIPMFIVSRFLHGVQFAFVGSLNLTLASDSLPREKLGSGLGVFGMGSALTTAIGPGVGIAIRDFGNTTWGDGMGYKAVFGVAAITMLIALVPIALMPRPPKPEKGKTEVWYKNIISAPTIFPAVIMCLVSMGSILFTSYMVPYAETLGIQNIALFFTVYAIFLLGARPIFGRISDAVGPNKVLIPGLVIFVGAFVVVCFGRSLPVMLGGAVLYALGFGSANPAIQTICVRSVPAERRGVASNTTYFGIDLGYFAGPLIGSMVYKALGYSYMYLLCGVGSTVLALLVFVAIWPKLKKNLY